MEFAAFETIRKDMCDQFEGVTEGKMMSSPAIHFRGKVFAFFSRKNKMVFKLGERIDVHLSNNEMRPFSPFKNKKPLKGWYEVDYERHDEWKQLAEVALERFKTEDHG